MTDATSQSCITVICCSDDEYVAMARAFLPPTSRSCRGAGRLYLFYQTQHGSDYAFKDLNGQSIIESHTFPTLDAADAWVVEDARQRGLVRAAKGTKQ